MRTSVSLSSSSGSKFKKSNKNSNLTSPLDKIIERVLLQSKPPRTRCSRRSHGKQPTRSEAPPEQSRMMKTKNSFDCIYNSQRKFFFFTDLECLELKQEVFQKQLVYQGAQPISQKYTKWRYTHLSSEYPAHADNTKDVEDCRPDDGPHAHITVGDEDTCAGRGANQESAVPWMASTIWKHLSPGVCVCVCLVPMTDAKSSGAELPAAMKVAPATSSLRSSFCEGGKKGWVAPVIALLKRKK